MDNDIKQIMQLTNWECVQILGLAAICLGLFIFGLYTAIHLLIEFRL